MSQLDDLLARSRAPGQLVERRTFTLSREKAIEKQREFALRHPRQYVLELVQAAVFGGASYIAIDTRPHSLLVAWVGGTPFTVKELEGLFDYLFADRGDARWRHLVQLAIGVNAVLQRRPRALRIESGDGQRAIRMDLDASGQATVGIPSDSIAGTYLYVEYGGGWFSRFASSNSLTAEQALVEERCLYTPVPILLNGSAPFGYRGSRHIEIFGARLQEHFDDGQRRGVVALHSSPRAPTGFRMVVGGVWVSTLPLANLADRPLVGVVCDDDLRKTADQSDIVQDHRYTQMLHAVQPVATRLLMKSEGPRYRPPPLPPIPKIAAPTATSAPRGPQPEPLPDPLPMLAPRGATELSRLLDIGDTPLFYVDPAHEESLRGRTAEPDRFPWRVLVLTEGQALTLSEKIPDAALHRLTSKADVDFVRRVVDRRVRIRELVVPSADVRLTMRLHLEGPMPDWGHGASGIPFCVTDPHGTLEFGSVDGATIRVSGARKLTWEAERGIRGSTEMPRVSLRLEVDRADRQLEEHHLSLALNKAWELAVPDRGEPHQGLLCALLGRLAVPQLVRTDTGDIAVGASLPVGWPDSLRHVPLVHTEEGALTLEGFLALLGTPQTRRVRDLEALRCFEPIEARFGFGHLTHPDLEGEPLYGVGRLGNRWTVLEEPGMWAYDELTQLVWVGATFCPRRHDARWQTCAPGPADAFPELVGAVRADVEPEDWQGGWHALMTHLQDVEAERRWSRGVRAPVTAQRRAGLGRLALLHLAALLDRGETPLLVPSDGGGRRSLTEMRSHPAARLVARHGVRLDEPWTFALTRDEVAVVETNGSVAGLRYDDAPEVWRSLSEAEQGWLVRNEVRHGGLRGWLGLRCPHDSTSGILLRTTGQLIALSELDRSVPCHGLLWPDGGGAAITQEQRRVVQLAALRLYQDLVGILRDRPDPITMEAGCRYATTFVLLAWRRSHRLQGTAAELARLVPVHGPDGQPWDTLETWLTTPTDARPELPGGLAPEDHDVTTALERTVGPSDASIQARLEDALGPLPISLSIAVVDDSPREPPVVLDLARSHRGRAILVVNQHSPLARAALEGPSRHREILLLEMARLVCAWGGPIGLPLDLPRTQLVLLAQRIEA